MSANDGGPAFPVLELDQVTGNVCVQHMGMSLRDYFAGQALQGWLANLPIDVPARAEIIAPTAYRFADAMLKARSQS